MTEVNVPTNYELRNHVSVAELTRISEQSTSALAVKMFQQGFEEGRKSIGGEMANEIFKVKAGKVSKEQIQKDRDEIVESSILNRKLMEMIINESVVYSVRYVINLGKRTVVCLIERDDLGYVHKRGIAKCSPGDCFNESIGKYIALCRAFEVEVGNEFMFLTNPTDVQDVDTVNLFGEVIDDSLRYSD